MKKLLFVLLFGATLSLQAQIEVKINPVTTILGAADIQGEYLLNENFGVELSLQPFFGKTYAFLNSEDYDGTQSGFAEKLRAKYYYSPYNGGDQWYVDIFAVNSSVDYTREYSADIGSGDYVNDLIETFKQSYTGIGFEVGAKKVTDTGFIFEYSLGIGSYLSSDFQVIPDSRDTDRGIDKIKPESIFFSGKLVVGYRFGDF